jgi:hypothetical protein
MTKYFFYFLKIYFVFEPAYINNTRGFHCGNSDMCTVYFEQVPPLHYISAFPSVLSSFSNSVWWI